MNDENETSGYLLDIPDMIIQKDEDVLETEQQEEIPDPKLAAQFNTPQQSITEASTPSSTISSSKNRKNKTTKIKKNKPKKERERFC